VLFRPGGDHMTVNRRRFMLLAVALIALNSFFWLAPGGFALSRGIIDQFFGQKLIRAEVVVQTPTGVQDYLIDRGVIKAVIPGSITLKEKDDKLVTIQLASAATVTGPGGRSGKSTALRPGLRVIVYRVANAPAESIQVEGIGG
jgi:hypothetical protein